MDNSSRVGFSTTVIGRSLDLGRLAVLEPEIIELCGYSAAQWPSVRAQVERLGIPVGLHCPLPFEGFVPYFDITGPDPSRQEEAFALVRETLRAAHEVKAQYVVVHFPSVLRGPLAGNAAPESRREEALRSARRLSELSRQYGVAVLLENVGPNPYLYLGEHFTWLFGQVPELRMCLDFGHAHVLPGTEDVYRFAEQVAPFVVGLHVYNATRDGYRVGFHDAPLAEHNPEEGWMDLSTLLASVARRSSVPHLVFEYSEDCGQDAAAVRRGVEHWIATWRRLCREGI